MQEIPKRSDFIHHQNSRLVSGIREIVFGSQDGMVSTLGALVGIAIGTHNQFTVVLAGLVIIAVQSISMGVGSYLSHKSVREVEKRKLYEEQIEIEKYPEAEKLELIDIYIKDGWPGKVARQIVEIIAKDDNLLLKEMAYRELRIIPDHQSSPFRQSIFMFVSYVVGGVIPILPYLLLPITVAIIYSIIITFFGLFILGIVTTKFTKRIWWWSGLEMLLLAGSATVVGYLIGKFASAIV